MENGLENITQTLQTSKGNIILKAGAGTGKTYNLTERVISLIINERCRLDQILAMTFTDYAAAEMRERIYNRISDALQQKEKLSPELIDHLQREKREFGKNYISTFHSFCSRILQYYPDELSAITINLMPEGLPNETYGNQKSIQLDSGFEILDDYNEAILTLDWQKAFYKRYKDHPGLQNQLRSLKRRDLEDFLGQVASDLSGDDLLKLATLGPADYLEVLKAIHSDLLKTVKEKFDEVIRIIEAHPDWFKRDFSHEMEPFLGSGEVLTGKFELRKKFVEKDAKDEVAAIIDPLTKELGAEYKLVRDLQQYIQVTNASDIEKARNSEEYNANHEAYWNLTEIAELSLRWSMFMRYQRFKVRKLNFDDIIWLADRLFSENPQVANQLSNRFKYVLVDEFQDTDKRQWEIVKRLSHWADEGNVLLVGDMKQAIYRFRGGDVTMMRVAEQELNQNNGDELTSLELNYSFRSNKAVVEFCNAFFRHCFSDDTDYILYEASPQNLKIPPADLSIRGDVPGKILIMGYSAEVYDENVYKVNYEAFFKDEKEQYLEALRIARFLHEIRLGKHGEYEPIREKLISNEKAVGILYRRRKYQHFMEQALDLYKLPYAVSSGRNFFSRQEILDCHNLLAFMLDAHDDISLAGVLRSPFTGLSDVGLLTIRNVMDHSDQKDPAFWPVISDFDQWNTDQLLPTDKLALTEIVPVLNELREDSKYVRVSDLLEKAMRKTNFLNGYLDQPQAGQNVNKLIDIIRDLEQKEQGNLFEIVEFLRTQIDQDSDEKDAELPDTGAIQIMTVHGSKGLEFPMVIVPDLTASLRNGGLQIYTSPSDAYVNNLPLLAYKAEDKDNYEKDEDTQFIFELLKQQNKKRDIAELRRVFYVALTRAQTHILISDTSSYPNIKNASLSFSGFMNDWLNAEREKYDDLLDFDLLTKEEFQEITDVIAGKLKIENPDADDSEKQLLDDELLENAMKRAKLVSRNVSQTIHNDDEQQTLEQMVTSPWKKVKPDHAGTIVHKMLETGVRDEDQQELLIKNLLRQNGYSLGDDNVQEDLQRIKREAAKARNWLNERFSHPQKILHEQAFECRLKLEGEEQYVRGIIDLLVKDQNGEWHLIDFKTNAVKGEEFAELAKLAGYDRQLRIYQKAASIISNGEINIPDRNTGLLFTTGENPVWLTIDKLPTDDAISN